VNEYAMCNLKKDTNITPNRPEFNLLKSKRTSCGSAGNTKWTATDSITEQQLFTANSLYAYVTPGLDNFDETTKGLNGYYPNTKSGADYNWKLFSRRYVPWTMKCRDRMKPLVEKTDFVTALRKAQLGVLVVGILSGVVLGIVLSYMELQNLRGKDIACIQGEGEDERKRIKRIKKILNYVFKLTQIPFQIWAIIMASLAKTLFNDLADEACSDAETQATLTFLAKSLTSTYTSTLTALALLLATIVLDLLLTLWEKRKKTNSTQPIQIQSKNNSDDVLALQNNSSTARLEGSFVKSPEIRPQMQNNGSPNVVIQLQQMPQQNPNPYYQPQPQPQYPQGQFPQPQYPGQLPQQQYPQQQYPQQYPQQQQPTQPVSFGDRFAKLQGQQ
jgi:hypothetical protein